LLPAASVPTHATVVVPTGKVVELEKTPAGVPLPAATTAVQAMAMSPGALTVSLFRMVGNVTGAPVAPGSAQAYTGRSPSATVMLGGRESVQALPSPLKPSLQEHTKVPLTLVQAASAEQSSVLRAHSLMSFGDGEKGTGGGGEGGGGGRGGGKVSKG
jgi:hypothetical protein